jgi:hypothetical protein
LNAKQLPIATNALQGLACLLKILGDSVELTFSAISMSIGTQRKTSKAFRIASLKLNARKFTAFKTFAMRRFRKIVIKKKEFFKMKLIPKRRGNCEGTAVDANDMVDCEQKEESDTAEEIPISYNIAKTRNAKANDADSCKNINFYKSILR